MSDLLSSTAINWLLFSTNKDRSREICCTFSVVLDDLDQTICYVNPFMSEDSIQLTFPDCQCLFQFQRLEMTKNIPSPLNGRAIK